MPGFKSIPSEVVYLALIFALIVIPRAIQRFRLPAPLTSFGLGMVAASFTSAVSHDATLSLLAALGISSLFLFAGLEVNLADLHRARWHLGGHLALHVGILAAATWAGINYLGFGWETASLLALALFTPSTGFILESLESLGLDTDERYWVTVKAVGAELLALVIVFVVLQSESVTHLAAASGALLLLIIALPVLFRILDHVVVPHAPGAEFSLLVMVGLVAATLTNALGVHFLLGAFLAGFVARLLRPRMPRLASDGNLKAIALFASFFVPFYFFYEGLSVPSAAFSWTALELGAGITAMVLPARIVIVWLQRRFIRGETGRGSLRVAVALSPTLIFTLVLATILRERYKLADTLYAALLIYAAFSTLVPALVMRRSGPAASLPAEPAPDPPTDARVAVPLVVPPVAGDA